MTDQPQEQPVTRGRGRPKGAKNRHGFHPKDIERLRAFINSEKLIKGLLAHALGTKKMESSQIKAAEILLKKTIPDLKAVEFSGEVDGALTITIVRHVSPDITINVQD